MVFFHTPSDVADKHIAPGTRFRLGGLFEAGSVVRGQGTAVQFSVTDTQKTLPVTYAGILPDLFREGQGVVAEGTLNGAGIFQAAEPRRGAPAGRDHECRPVTRAGKEIG